MSSKTFNYFILLFRVRVRARIRFRVIFRVRVRVRARATVRGSVSFRGRVWFKVGGACISLEDFANYFRIKTKFDTTLFVGIRVLFVESL